MNYDEHNGDGYSGAGQYPGSYKPVKKPPGPPLDRGESAGIFCAPTARSKFRELRVELNDLVKTIERGKRKVSDPVGASENRGQS
jgi:hypothetical protein